MKDELERMKKGELADMTAPEIQASFKHCKNLLAQLRTLSPYDNNYRPLLKALIPDLPDSSTVFSPFFCDHGHGIHLGEHVFINANCTFLDGGNIYIGDHTLIGPNVQLYTPQHPMDYLERRDPKEYSLEIRIGNDCWIGGGAIICPGVHIGNRCIIGAGSVVTKNIPDDSIAMGNPAKIKKKS